MVQYLLNLWERLQALGSSARQNLLHAEDTQEAAYNKQARLREFQPGDWVLLLLPSSESKLLAHWQGPYEVIRRVGQVNQTNVRYDKSTR